MNEERMRGKLAVLADAAKYDVSCSSSGSKRKNTGGLGNAEGMGICHSYTADGRCVSLLKILLTNHCIFDCAYCVSRRSNDVKRAAFTVQEVVDLTMNFYRRNFIEGLFLSSGIFKDADTTMERLVRVAKELRTNHRFHGYIHLKTIPGASEALVHEAGLYADRLSINIEIPSNEELKKVAPEKDHAQALAPMSYLQRTIQGMKEERRTVKSAPLFAPAGQSTQLVVGATPDSDLTVLTLAGDLYRKQRLKRVFYSGYVPISTDRRVPFGKPTPVLRENRLYQSDWLLRFYGYRVDELVDAQRPELDLDLDPKTSHALRHPHLFPVDANTAPIEMLLRVPGIGTRSAALIVQGRRRGRVRMEHLAPMGVVVKRAKYFLSFLGEAHPLVHRPDLLRPQLITPLHRPQVQLDLFSAA
ncbi:MAG TPA: putative DNA modification/repair radical SAM protein [Flavobacteriales bacterium]